MNKISKNTTPVWKGFYYPWTYPSNWWKNFGIFFRNLKAAFQRAKYGVAIQDCWNLDSYLNMVFKNGLINFKDHNWGYPGILTAEEWDNVLDHMMELVEAISIDSTECSEAEKYWDVDNDKWFKEVQKYDIYKQDCLNELCDILKEYYWDLWW